MAILDNVAYLNGATIVLLFYVPIKTAFYYIKELIDIIVLMGHSASGKSTIEKKLTEKGYKKIVSYTTRPPRKGEVDGIDYHFVTELDFKGLKMGNKLAEHAIYRGWHYGILKEDCKNNTVAVVEPNGLNQLNAIEHLDITSFYIKTSENLRVSRMALRGDDFSEIIRRTYSDQGTFNGAEYIADHTINNDGDLDKTLEEILRIIEDV